MMTSLSSPLVAAAASQHFPTTDRIYHSSSSSSTTTTITTTTQNITMNDCRPQELPDELLIHILSFIDPIDLYHSYRTVFTCKHWIMNLWPYCKTTLRFNSMHKIYRQMNQSYSPMKLLQQQQQSMNNHYNYMNMNNHTIPSSSSSSSSSSQSSSSSANDQYNMDYYHYVLCNNSNNNKNNRGLDESHPFMRSNHLLLDPFMIQYPNIQHLSIQEYKCMTDSFIDKLLNSYHRNQLIDLDLSYHYYSHQSIPTTTITTAIPTTTTNNNSNRSKFTSKSLELIGQTCSLSLETLNIAGSENLVTQRLSLNNDDKRRRHYRKKSYQQQVQQQQQNNDITSSSESSESSSHSVSQFIHQQLKNCVKLKELDLTDISCIGWDQLFQLIHLFSTTTTRTTTTSTSTSTTSTIHNNNNNSDRDDDDENANDSDDDKEKKKRQDATQNMKLIIRANHLTLVSHFDEQKFIELCNHYSLRIAIDMYEHAFIYQRTSPIVRSMFFILRNHYLDNNNDTVNALNEHLLYDHYYYYRPRIETCIEPCLLLNHHKTIFHLLKEVDYPFHLIPISLVERVIRLGHSKTLNYLRLCQYPHFDQLSQQVINELILRGDYECMQVLRGAKLDRNKWIQVPTSVIQSAIMNNRRGVIEQLNELQLPNLLRFQFMDLSLIHHVIQNGYVGILKTVLSSGYEKAMMIEPMIVLSCPAQNTDGIMSLLKTFCFAKYEQVRRVEKQQLLIQTSKINSNNNSSTRDTMDGNDESHCDSHGDDDSSPPVGAADQGDYQGKRSSKKKQAKPRKESRKAK